MRKISYLPLAFPPERFIDYATYKDLFNYDSSYRFYGAFYKGQQVGYGASKDGEIVHISSVNPEIDQGLYNLIRFHTRTAKPKGKTKSPKDMIKSPIPFVYDAPKGHIQIGYEGEKTRDIQPYRGPFSKGGIVEGEYQPGGKFIIYPSSPHLCTTRSILNAWKRQFPQMEVTSVEMDTGGDKTHKVASNTAMDPAQYVKVLASIDPAASNAYRALTFAGGKVYVVGGAIRDALRGDDPRDLDLMVSGLPTEEVNDILSKLPGRVDLTGKRFGVYRYRHDGSEVEIALPRQDKYDTGRRGEGQITVDHNLPVEDDLRRRDFTVNSMGVNLDNGQLIDPYGGQRDLEKHILRTTHPDAFSEDPTRLVRALTAHSRFGLNPDETTRGEMVSNAHLLRGESPDALNKTLDKLFASHNPAAAIRLAHDTGILKHLFPEVHDQWDYDQRNPHHKYPLGEHLMNVLGNVAEHSSDPDLRMAAMLHDIGKPASAWEDPVTNNLHFYEKHEPDGTVKGADHERVGAQMAEDRLRALNYPRARINRVTNLIGNHMFSAFSSPKGARRFLQSVGDGSANDLLDLRQADMGGKGQGQDYFNARTSVDKMRELVDQSRKNQAPTDLQNLAINGNDLIALGMQSGPQVGQVLRNLLNHVVEVPTDNNHQRLIQLAQQYINGLPN